MILYMYSSSYNGLGVRKDVLPAGGLSVHVFFSLRCLAPLPLSASHYNLVGNPPTPPGLNHNPMIKQVVQTPRHIRHSNHRTPYI
jgi:hypothetical protein